MKPDLISLSVGGCVMAFGLLMMWSHRAAWARQKQEFAGDPIELRHHHARFRRRLQTSGLVGLIGLFIPIGDAIVWRQGPILSLMFWGAIGCLCLWIALLGVGDYLTTKAHARAALARLKAHQNELLDQLERLRPPPESPMRDKG
jgi:hypothetical protein